MENFKDTWVLLLPEAEALRVQGTPPQEICNRLAVLGFGDKDELKAWYKRTFNDWSENGQDMQYMGASTIRQMEHGNEQSKDHPSDLDNAPLNTPLPGPSEFGDLEPVLLSSRLLGLHETQGLSVDDIPDPFLEGTNTSPESPHVFPKPFIACHRSKRDLSEDRTSLSEHWRTQGGPPDTIIAGGPDSARHPKLKKPAVYQPDLEGDDGEDDEIDDSAASSDTNVVLGKLATSSQPVPPSTTLEYSSVDPERPEMAAKQNNAFWNDSSKAEGILAVSYPWSSSWLVEEGEDTADSNWDEEDDEVDVVVPKLESIDDVDMADLLSVSTPVQVKRARGQPRKHTNPTPESMSKDAKGRRKTGCITCRKRKKKCDETKPNCMNCERNWVKCEGYPEKILWKSEEEKAEEGRTTRSISDTYSMEYDETKVANPVTTPPPITYQAPGHTLRATTLAQPIEEHGNAALLIGQISTSIFNLKTAKAFYNATHRADGLPGAFRKVATSIPLALEILKRAKRQAMNKRIDERTYKTAQLLMKECNSKSKKLSKIFNTVFRMKQSIKFERGTNESVIMNGLRVEGLMAGILGYVLLFATHRHMGGATKEQFKQLFEAGEKMGRQLNEPHNFDWDTMKAFYLQDLPLSQEGESYETSTMPARGPATDFGYASIGGDNTTTSLHNEIGDDACTIMTEPYDLDIETELRDKLSGSLADELFRSLEPVLHGLDDVSITMALGTDRIRGLLKDFSLKLRSTAKHGQEYDATVFVRQQRSRIAAVFDKNFQSLDPDWDDLEGKKGVEEINWKDKVANWDTTGSSGLSDINAASDAIDKTEGKEDYSISQLSQARDFLLGSRAYQELVERLRAEVLLTGRDGTIINDIRTTILSELEVYPKKTNRYNVSNCTALFTNFWDPVEFLKRQFPGSTPPMIGEILVYTGTEIDAQASTCEQYIRQTWGSAGIEVLRGLEEVIRIQQHGRPHKVRLSGDSWFEVILKDSIAKVYVCGSQPVIADTGELLAWISAAIRESPHRDEMAISTPCITRKPSKNPDFFLKASLQPLDPSSRGQRPNGTCWHSMTRNPVVVKGFPIPKRSFGEKGLEIRLPLMAYLGNAERATVFDQGLVIKGHSTMFVPIERDKQSVLWHFLYHEDETRISYLEASKFCPTRLGSDALDASHLEISRNFVGWSSSVSLQTGMDRKSINYDGIKWTGSNYASAGCALEKVSISGGKIINAGVTFARGTKDTPLYLRHAMTYEQEIHNAGNMYVVLYDMADKRAWLVDGACALLHLTCTQLSTVWSYKSSLFQLEQLHFAKSSDGHTAAASALLDSHNRKLPIFEEVETWKEVTTRAGIITSNQARKEENKEKTTQWCYQDLVRQTYHLLELMHDYQVKVLTAPVTNLRFTDRDKLEGFAFMDIVDGPSAILPRVAYLKRSGRGWVDFTRRICAITLMARGFGELIKPTKTSNALCRQWQSVPLGKDYLVACVSTLSKICERQGDPEAKPLELARGIFWHQAHMMFESCKCREGSFRSTCDRLQVLLPPSLGQKRHPKPFQELNGGVIFGRSKRYTWTWPKRGKPTEGDIHDEEEEESNDEDVVAHDSGIGTSIQSSSNSGIEGDWAESQSADYPSTTTPLIHAQDTTSVSTSGASADEEEQEFADPCSQYVVAEASDMLMAPQRAISRRLMPGSALPTRTLDMRPCEDTETTPAAPDNQERPKILKRKQAFEKMGEMASSEPPSSQRVREDQWASDSS